MRFLFCFLWTLGSIVAFAQRSVSAFEILRLPLSAHQQALGGSQIALTESDPSFSLNNPALLANIDRKQIQFNFAKYIADSKYWGLTYAFPQGERHSFATSLQLLNFGKMAYTTPEGQELGTFTANDIILTGSYSYMLTDRWAGGASLKLLYSQIQNFKTLGLSTDLGLNYWDEEKLFSFSTVLLNIGGIIGKSEGLSTATLPFDWQLGFSYRLSGSPLRFSLTFTDLLRWGDKYFINVNPTKKSSIFHQAFLHSVIGADLYFIPQFYIALGYNARRAYELNSNGLRSAGFSFGGGYHNSKLSIQATYAKLHPNVGSLLLNAAYQF